METYVVYVIAKAEADAISCQQLLLTTALCYSEDLWENPPRFVRVYDESRLKSVFTEGMTEPILFHMRIYWGTNKYAALHSLVRHTKSSVKLQENFSSSSSSTREDSKSQAKLSRPSRVTWIIPVMAIEVVKRNASSSSRRRKRRRYSSYMRKKKKKVSTIVAGSAHRYKESIDILKEYVSFCDLS